MVAIGDPGGAVVLHNALMRRHTQRLIWVVALVGACAHDNGARDAATGEQVGGDRPLLETGSPAVCGDRVLVDEVVNARDLGGHALQGGFTVACGQIMRGGDLCSLGDPGCAELSQLGIKTVIDLREDKTQQSQPPTSCVTSQASVINAAMPKLPVTPENYVALLREEVAVAAIFKTLGDASSYPVYIHCVIGRDRASFVTALVLLALGAERQTVIDEFELSEQAQVSVQTSCIEAVLDEIDKKGGIETYLKSLGVTTAQLDALRAAGRASGS